MTNEFFSGFNDKLKRFNRANSQCLFGSGVLAVLKQPTIHDVAKLAGVATGTVSNVLNGSDSVRDLTREKVEIAIRQLGFRPDAIARSLISRRGRGGSVKPVGGLPKLSTVGYISVDYTARIDAFPETGERMTSHGIKKSLGGPAANVAVMAAGLGGRCAINCELITTLGTDPDSEWALAQLAGRGVQAITIHPYQSGRLSRCIVLVDKDGTRTIINEPFELELDDLARCLGRPASDGARHCLHAEGYQASTIIRLLGEERPPNLITSVHATGLPLTWHTLDGLGKLLDNFDVVFINRGSACHMLACDANLTAIREGISATFPRLATSRRARLLVVTLGAEGSLIIPLDAEPELIPATNGPVVDTTGAGDAFVGCYLASWLSGDDPISAGRLATVAGGLAVGVEGAQGARITMDMLAAHGIPAEIADASARSNPVVDLARKA